MKDTALSIWLITLFGISGAAVLVLAWLWPALEIEKGAATFAGAIGLLPALTKLISLRHVTGSAGNRQAAVVVKSEDNS